MAYNVYQGDNLIAEKITEKEYTAEGLTPNTEYSFSVSEIIGEKESEKATITVKTQPIAVTGIAVAPKAVTLEVGETQQLTSTITPANATNKVVTYASKAQGVASVGEDGLITAVTVGSTDITATSYADGSKIDICTVTVVEPVVGVTGVELSPKNMTGESGTAATRQLTPTVAPENATNKSVTYSVEPTAEGLTVNASGVLAWTDAVGAGEYTVTVKTTDGNKTATSTLTLSAPEPDPEPEPEE